MDRSSREVKDSAYAEAIARGIPAKKLGYSESMNARPGLYPREGYKTAGPDEELVTGSPAAYLYIVINGDGGVIVNGSSVLQPRHIYADGVREYEYKSVAQTPAGQRPAITSVKITEGAEYRYKLDTIPTGAGVWR